MEKQYFFCYANEDVKLADSLKEELVSNGYKCWLSTKLIDQPNKEKITNKALVESDVVILIFTENTSNASNIRTELDIASNLRIPILTLEFQKSDPSESILYYTHGHKWIDCRFKQEYTPEIIQAIFDLSKKNNNEAQPPSKKPSYWWKLAIVIVVLFSSMFFICHKKPIGEPTQKLLNIAVGNAASWDYASDACVTTNGNFFVTGGWNWGYWNKIWVAQLNENGDLLNIWSDSIVGECQPQLLPCLDNSCIVIYADLTEITNSNIVITAVKLNTSNNIVWQTKHEIPIENATGIRLSDISWIQSNSISASFSIELPGGNQHIITNVIINSNSGETTDFTLLNHVDLHNMAVTPTGNLLYFSHLSALNEDVITILSPNGNNISTSTFSNALFPVAIEFTADTAFVVLKTTGGANGILSVEQLSNSYETQWKNEFENDLTGIFSDLIILDNGNILLAGSTAPDNNNETDGRLICLDNNGKILWLKTIDNGANDQISSINVSHEGRIVLTGTTSRFGNRDAWFLSLSPEGNFNANCILGFTILYDNFEQGFINRDLWNIQLNQTDPPIINTVTNNEHCLYLQSGLIVQKNIIQNVAGLVFTAEINLQENIQTNDSGWVAFGTSELGLIEMLQPNSKIPDCSFQIIFSPDNTMILNTSRIEPHMSLTLTGFSSSSNTQTHLIEIESQEDSIYFSADGNLLFKTQTTIQPDSLYFFIEGNAPTIPYSIDNIRIYQKSW